MHKETEKDGLPKSVKKRVTEYSKGAFVKQPPEEQSTFSIL